MLINVVFSLLKYSMKTDTHLIKTKEGIYFNCYNDLIGNHLGNSSKEPLDYTIINISEFYLENKKGW